MKSGWRLRQAGSLAEPLSCGLGFSLAVIFAGSGGLSADFMIKGSGSIFAKSVFAARLTCFPLYNFSAYKILHVQGAYRLMIGVNGY